MAIIDPDAPSVASTCTACLQSKPLSEFHKRSDGKKKLTRVVAYWCKPCIRDYQASRKAGAAFKDRQRAFRENTSAKTCTACNLSRSLDGFAKSRSTVDGLAHVCRTCSSEYSRIHRSSRQHFTKLLLGTYGITFDRWSLMLLEQCGRCASCASPLNPNGPNGACVDHDHSDGRVRGVLCGPCNRALGQVADSIQRLNALVAYMKGQGYV